MNTAPVTPATDPEADELERHGIVRIATERFEFGNYRYERLADAIAEARRHSREPGSVR